MRRRRTGSGLVGHHIRAVGEHRRDESEHVAIRVEQVADATDALHVSQRQRLGAAEAQPLREQLVDAAVDADHEITAVDWGSWLGGGTLALREPPVDAATRRIHSDRTFAGVYGPIRHVTELGEPPPQQFCIEVDEPLRLGCMYLEVHNEVRHDASLSQWSSRYAALRQASTGRAERSESGLGPGLALASWDLAVGARARRWGVTGSEAIRNLCRQA